MCFIMINKCREDIILQKENGALLVRSLRYSMGRYSSFQSEVAVCINKRRMSCSVTVSVSSGQI